MTQDISNAREVIAILETVSPRIATNLNRSTIHGIANKARDEIKRRAPDDPSTPESIAKETKTRRRKSPFGKARSDVEIKDPTWYWFFLEYGTVKFPARPFVRPAAELVGSRLREEYIENFSKAVAKAIAREAKRRGA